MSFVLVLSLVCTVPWDDSKPVLIEVPGRAPCLEAIAALPRTTRRIKLTVRDHASIGALAARCPELEQLVLIYPGNRMENDKILPIVEFRKLERLTIQSDLFLTDEMFAAIGRMKTLRSLRLNLI